MRTDRRKDVTNLTLTFHNFAKAPEKKRPRLLLPWRALLQCDNLPTSTVVCLLGTNYEDVYE